ncbi:hypothetical protein HNQ94_001290 [Salirhabdus euzebyi]|uniref:TIGR01777 family protein n=1 Tax=Salirhabdus euzebyi TaxID=394506 RepID=A0A841Q383_9BACI|nr:TIGR01777 family oxidoreductase [Salirhabdus euzebyi]MBB6452844.1 hypothetical protein [Salirhabdus euzebyi]
MNILIAGGTGFIGQKIVQSFDPKQDTIYILTRSSTKKSDSPHIHYITWLNENENSVIALPDIDVVINLAGDPLNKGRWTEKKKKEIIESRKKSTRSIIQLMNSFSRKPNVFINASAVGIYGNSFSETFTEQSQSLENSFPAKVCTIWEKEAIVAKELGIRTVVGRIGVVLSKDGGALPKMALPYHLFGGGKVASGKQWVSWIHMDDLVQLFHFIIQNEQIEGPVNLTAPNPTQMNELGKAIGKALKRPHWIPVPTIMLRLIFGQMSEFLTEGQRVIPHKVENLGFTFTHKNVKDALQNIYNE